MTIFIHKKGSYEPALKGLKCFLAAYHLLSICVVNPRGDWGVRLGIVVFPAYIKDGSLTSYKVNKDGVVQNTYFKYGLYPIWAKRIKNLYK